MNRYEALRFLGACLSPTLPDTGTAMPISDFIAGNKVDWPEVIALADNHYVLPLMHYMLLYKGLTDFLPKEVGDTLAELYRLNQSRNTQLRKQLVEVIRQLNKVGETPLLLKGAVALMGDFYPEPGCRMMGDLDLLLPERGLQVGVRALKAMRYQPMGRPKQEHHLPCLEHPERIGRLELHWEIARPRHTKLLRGATMYEAAKHVENDGLHYKMSTRNQMAMHNIIHHQFLDTRYRNRTFQLYQVYDLVRLMQTPSAQISWSRIFKHFDDHGYGAAVAAYFMLIRHLFGMPLPDGVRRTVFARIEFGLILAQWNPPQLLGSRLLNILAQMPFPHNKRHLLKVMIAPGSYRQGIDAVKAALLRR